MPENKDTMSVPTFESRNRTHDSAAELFENFSLFLDKMACLVEERKANTNEWKELACALDHLFLKIFFSLVVILNVLFLLAMAA